LSLIFLHFFVSVGVVLFGVELDRPRGGEGALDGDRTDGHEGGTAGNETVGPAGDRDITGAIDAAVEASKRRDEDKGGS